MVGILHGDLSHNQMVIYWLVLVNFGFDGQIMSVWHGVAYLW